MRHRRKQRNVEATHQAVDRGVGHGRVGGRTRVLQRGHAVDETRQADGRVALGGALRVLARHGGGGGGRGGAGGEDERLRHYLRRDGGAGAMRGHPAGRMGEGVAGKGDKEGEGEAGRGGIDDGARPDGSMMMVVWVAGRMGNFASDSSARAGGRPSTNSRQIVLMHSPAMIAISSWPRARAIQNPAQCTDRRGASGGRATAG